MVNAGIHEAGASKRFAHHVSFLAAQSRPRFTNLILDLEMESQASYSLWTAQREPAVGDSLDKMCSPVLLTLPYRGLILSESERYDDSEQNEPRGNSPPIRSFTGVVRPNVLWQVRVTRHFSRWQGHCS